MTSPLRAGQPTRVVQDITRFGAADDQSGICVAWLQSDRRYGHRIGCAHCGKVNWFLESWEGDDVEHYPPSPACQQLSVEARSDGDVALLLGMAGTNHWSLSVEVDADRQQLSFDVAARSQARPEQWLGSVYRLMPGCRLSKCAGRTGEVTWARIEPDHHSGSGTHHWQITVTTHSIDDQLPARLDAQADRLQIAPAHRQSATARWAYRIGLDRS